MVPASVAGHGCNAAPRGFLRSQPRLLPFPFYGPAERPPPDLQRAWRGHLPINLRSPGPLLPPTASTWAARGSNASRAIFWPHGRRRPWKLIPDPGNALWRGPVEIGNAGIEGLTVSVW